MDYQEFLDYVKENILEYMDADGDEVVDIHITYKNNDVRLDGLTIRHSGDKIAPNLYLNDFYKEYEKGKDLAEIMRSIVRQYQALHTDFDMSPDMVLSADRIRECVILRLVNHKKNERLLEEIPFVPFEDLAVTFRWLVSMDAGGIATTLVHERDLIRWGISKEALYDIALDNTRHLFPPIIRPLGNLLMEYLKDMTADRQEDSTETNQVQDEIISYMSGDMHRPTFYVLTNTCGLNGATCMLYPGVIAEFAETIGQDLFILPSSIHEVLLVPDTEDIDAQNLHDMVMEANDTVVFDSEILSDNVYYYSRNEKSVKAVFES